MNIKAVICDCDGVILDSFREGLRRIRMLCAIHEIPYSLKVRQRLTTLWGMAGVQLLQEGLNISEFLAHTMYAHWEKLDLSEPVPHVPAARDALYWLRRNGFVTILLTSRNRENITAIFDRMDLLKEFAFLSTRDDYYYSKPDPRAFRFGLEKLQNEYGVGKSECLFVGDTPADIQGGANAGIRTIVVQTGPYMLEHTERYPIKLGDIIPSIDELPLWIEKHHEGDLAYAYF